MVYNKNIDNQPALQNDMLLAVDALYKAAGASSLFDDNGYRYYSLSQYFSLEILITMRKLDIPLQDIMFYLKNKNPS